MNNVKKKHPINRSRTFHLKLGWKCLFLLQQIFSTQGLNPGLPHCRQTLYRLSHQHHLNEGIKPPNWGSPCSLVSKESVCSAGVLDSIPGSGISSGEGNGNPLQCSCLGNLMFRRVWEATVHGAAKSQTWRVTFTITFIIALRITYLGINLQKMYSVCTENSKSPKEITEDWNECIYICHEHWLTDSIV